MFSHSFKTCVLILNLVTFLGSMLYLLALLFTLTIQGKNKLLRYSSHVQILSALLVIFFMVRLWFWPFKLRLDQSDKWLVGMLEYDYTLSRCTSRLSSPNICDTSPTYTQIIDRVQDALGCCGLWGPKEWNYKMLMGLIAPSCCPNPVSFSLTSFIQHPASLDGYELEEKNRWKQGQVFYCQTVPIERSIGCQSFLDDHETRFMFSLRLTLLFMLGLQFINLLSAQTIISMNVRQVNPTYQVTSLSSAVAGATSCHQSNELVRKALFVHEPICNQHSSSGQHSLNPEELNVGESVITIS